MCQSFGDLARRSLAGRLAHFSPATAPTVSSRSYLVVVVHLHHVPLAVAHAAGDVR